MAVFLLFLLSPVSLAFSAVENLSLGLGYPYISFKYDLPVISAEGRLVSGSGVQAYTGRGYWNFHKADNLKGFAGLEGGYIKFDTLDVKGAGYEGAVFVGGEYFITKQLSLMMDFAPTLISLKSGGLDASGLEYVVNLGIYWHFGEARSKAGPQKKPVIKPDINQTPTKDIKVPAVPAPPAESVVKKETGSPAIRGLLVRLKSPDSQQRSAAAFELGKIRAAEAVAPLLELLDDANDKVCGMAALALGRIGDRRALKPLIERLEDESIYVRASAAKALGDLRDKRAIKPLGNALRDDSAQVRKAAAGALRMLQANNTK